jgi:HEAT repeats
LEAEPKVEAAARALRRLRLAIKASALYPASHPARAAAADIFLRDLLAYTETYGSFSLHVGKQKLSVDDLPIDGHTSLADFLYTRKLSQITILPTADQSQIATFVSIASMERSQLEAAGGLEHLLQEAGVCDIRVTELVLRVKEETEILDLGAFYSLIGQGRLSPQERDRVIDILRSGADQVAKLLQNVYSLAADVQREIGEEGHAQQVYEAVRSLDRIILDEPGDRQQLLYEHLAEAALRLGPSLGRRVIPMLLSGANEDVGVQIVLGHLSGDHLAELIVTALADGGSTDQVTSILRSLSLEREKAAGVLSALDRILAGRRPRDASLTSTILPQLRFAYDARGDASTPTRFDETAIAISAEELAAYRQEVQSIDEAGAGREALRTLLDVLCNEVEQRELLDVADSLAGYLRGIVELGDFARLRESLESLRDAYVLATAPRKTVFDGLLEGVLAGPFLDQSLAVLSYSKKTVTAHDIRVCLNVLSKQAIAPLVRMLGGEQRPGMRGFLCDLLVDVAPGHVDELGAFVGDQRWYVLRDIAYILGRMRRPEGITYLVRLARHADVRVRMEVLGALTRIGTDPALAQICLFLHDPEQMVRLKALSSLDARGLRLAMSALAPLLEAPDLLNRWFVFRRAAINAVALLNVGEALPSLKKLARVRVALGRCRRELRRLAHEAVVSIEQAQNVQAPDGGGGSL